MEIALSESSRRFLARQVATGRYPSELAVIEDAVERLRHASERPDGAAATDPIAGMFRDEPELIDAVVEEAMQIREGRPWRLPSEP
jgi:Arc/MetJ-type ribon-helix-helix transcriptional regulator